MRKFLSFLALFVMAFALPHKAAAWDWDFSGGTNPKSINLYLETGNKSCPMEFSNSQWTTEFVATASTMEFKLNTFNSSGKEEWFGYGLAVPLGSTTRVYVNSNAGKYSFTGLTIDKTYKVTLTGYDHESCNMKIEEASVQTPLDFSTNTNPKSVKIKFNNGNGNFDLTFKNGVWSNNNVKITNVAGESYANYQIEVTRSDGTTATHGQDKGTSTYTPAGTWTDAIEFRGSGTFYQGGLTANSTYRVELTGAGDNNFKIRFMASKPEVVWRLDGNTSPDKVIVHGSEGTTGDFTLDWNDKYAPGCWSTKFIAQKQNATFTIELFKGTEIDEVYGQNVTVAAGSESNELTLDRSAQGGTYKLSGLKIGKKYRLKLMGTGDNKFKYTVEELLGDNILYLYEMVGGSSSTTVKQIGEGIAVGEDGKCTFEANLTAGQFIVLSRNGGATTATGIQTYNGRYTPVASSSIPCTKSVFRNSNLGAWKVNVTDNYTITVDWTAKTLTAIGESNLPDAPANLYLYKSNSDASVFEMIGGSPCNGNIYTYTVDIETGMKVVLSSISDATSWDGINGQVGGNYVRYNPAGTLNIPGNDLPFALNEQTGDYQHGIWQTTQEGRYTITVNWATKTLTAICTYVPPTGTHMPLNSADFANGKKHYFLVGERMGEWHLQPEWEFQEKDGNLVLEGRYIYNGGFAVGVVDNFKDYVHHTFTYYCENKAVNSESAITLPTTGNIYEKGVGVGNTRFNPDDRYYSAFDESVPTGDNNPRYWQGRGVYMSTITLTLNGDKPATLQFTKGEDEDAAKNRVFTLVGDNIYNRNYCNTTGTGKTTMKNRGFANMDGWQEGWIQYDPTTNEPYVDARGEYLYHTSFTPDYLMTHPVNFNQKLPDNSDFSYTSNNVQFVEYHNLPSLDSDPYKDFYEKAFAGGRTIKPNDTERISLGDSYDFFADVECVEYSEADYTGNVVADNRTTSGVNWNCYVVRDMWVGGEIKFWTGWGGNDKKTEGNGNSNGAAWHGPNGGPDVKEKDRYTVKGYDVKSGQTAVLYKNVRNRNDTNYKVSDGKPVYFNRVVLWFNNEAGVNKSYIQFIQESAGPAIFAKVTNNGKEGKENKDNYITYNWYLNESQTGVEEDYEVISYEIRRYRVVNNVTTPIGYPEGEKVNIADVYDGKVTVKNLYESTAGNYSFTKHVDTGEVAGRGFAPGRYQYDIYVTYKNEKGESVRKYAMSNRVAIYDDALVTPDAVAMQLVQLRDEYYDRYTPEPHASGKTTLEQALKLPAGTFETQFAGGLTEPVNITTAGGEVTGQEEKVSVYLTYRTNDNANFYVMAFTEKEIVVGEATVKTVVPYKPMKVEAKPALEFIKNNADKFWWTSDYYLRCLDYDSYERTLQGYIDEGLIKNEEVPTPILQVDEIYNYTDESGEAQSVTKTRGYGQRFEFGDQTYYAMIVKRGGNLSNATFEVQLRYTYLDVHNESQTPETKATVGISPVMPRPFAPLYRYVYDRTSEIVHPETGEKYEWGKILVPTQNWTTENESDAIKNDLMKEAYVKFDDHFKPRTFTLQVDFNRPNVTKDIYQFYDIQYNIHVVNNDESGTGVDVPLDMDVVLHDVDTEDANFPNRYRMEFRGMHPRNGVYPTVEFVRTNYVPNEATGKFEEPYMSKTGNYGDMLTINAQRNLTVNRGNGIKDVHLGYIKRSDGTYDWMYKGHKELDDKPEIVDPTRPDENGKNEYEDQGSIDVQPIYYLIELKNPSNPSDCMYYPFLVPHIDGHRDLTQEPEFDKNGLMLHDTDPLIATYIAKGTNWSTAPDVVTTAIYMFERPLGGQQGNYSAYNFNRLEVESIKYNNTGEIVTPEPTPEPEPEPAAARPRAAKPWTDENRPTSADLVNGNAGGLPDADDLPTANVLDLSKEDNVTGYNAYVAVRGAHYADQNTNQNVTGVEDVLADGENGEAVYYNMQGMRIDEPTTAGVYFRVVGKNVTKFVVK